MRKLVFAVLLFFAVYSSFSQTGPGGVGNATGANGQPENVLWLRSNTGISAPGGFVDTWTDQSGNSNNAAGTTTTRPTLNLTDADFNNLPSITFPVGTNYFLQIPDNNNLDNTSTLSIFFIASPMAQSGINGIISKRTGAAANQSYFVQLTAGATPIWQTTVGTTGPLALHSGNTTTGAAQVDIISQIINGTSVIGQKDGTGQNTTVGPASIANNASSLFIGSFDAGVTTNFEGEIGEVIIFKSAINAAQRQIIENYLSSKYGATITGDLFAGDTPANGNHDFDLAGIGFTGGTSHLLANSQGLILSPSAGSVDANGEFVLAAHDGVTNVPSTANLGTGGVVQRWARTWYIDRNTGSVDANLTFDFSDGIGGQFPQNKDNYVLLKLNGSNYDVVSAITSSDKTLLGDQIIFRVADANLVDGVYTLGTLNSTASPVNGVSFRTWYSYQSGNWTTPTSWTLDGGVFPLLVNPSNEFPGPTDNVVITNGRTISMNLNGAQVNSIDVTGTLDLLASTGHNFNVISGSGRIKMSGSTDNFPLGTSTSFADAVIGGTLEINGAGTISLNQNRTFRNLEINLTGTADIASLQSDYTLNGNFTITNGLFQFNNTTIANRTLTVNGNTTISSTGGIRVGVTATSTRHEFNLFGDFTNAGTAYFTQRTAAATGSEATNGIVDVNLVSPSRDQFIACNGVTRFYRLEIKKGTDDTYKASFSASASTNFNLYGAANYTIDVQQAATNDNALGLIYGTAEFGANIGTIALPLVINTSGNYAIYDGAQLWINGAIAVKTGATAIVPYGKLRVSAGSLTADVQGGITTRESGVIQVDGGLVTVRQIRTSVAGASAVGSYIQSGGIVTVTGGATANTISDDFAVFSLTYPGNVFNMSGGILTIQNRPDLGTGSLRGAIFINSDPANISVTGGTVIMEEDNGVNYRITSRAPFWNLKLLGTGAARSLELIGTTAGTGTAPDLQSLGIQPLVVLNDFTIQNNANFTTNDANVTVGRDFEMQGTGTYIYGTNTTTMSGSGVGSFRFANVALTQNFYNLTISKTAATDETVIAAGRPSPNAAIQVNGTLTVSKGIFDYGAFIASARTTVTLASGVTVGKSASTGKLLLNGTVDQTLNSSGASVYNIDINNTDATPLINLATGNLSISGTLTLTSGIFNINALKLTMAGASATITGVATTRFIQTSGNESDLGLEMYVKANGLILFPIGTSAGGTTRYTPASVQISSYSNPGYIQINPVDGILQTTNIATGGAAILSYYWKTRYNTFVSPLPTVNYQFKYDDSDIGGAETNYRPGKVLDVSPFTRSAIAADATDDVVDGTNLIVFNGTSTGGTFPGTPIALEQANYTAGQTNRFTGSVEVYYSRLASGYWDDVNMWSTTRGGGSAGAVPGAGDVAVIRRTGAGVYSGIVSIRAAQSAAKVIFDDENGFSSGCPRIIFEVGTPFTSSLGVIEVASTHQGGTPLDGNSHGAVIQYNVTGSYAGVFPSGDFGSFNNYPNALVIYNWQSGPDGTITLSSAATEYPQLWFEGGTNARTINFPNTNVTVKGMAFINGNFSSIRVNGGNVASTLNFKQNLYIGSFGCCGDGTFQFQAGALADQIVQVDGSLFLTAGTNSINISSPATGSRSHRMIVKGNIDLVSGTTLNLGSGSTTETNVILELQGATNNTFTNAGSATLSRVIVNKGTSTANTFTFSDGFTLTGATNTATKALVLQNGLLVLDDAAINVILTSGGGDFNIPSTAGLEVRSGLVRTTATATSANITLDGLLRISGGMATIEAGAGLANYIEYSNSGYATLEVTAGTLTIGGQLRRSSASATGTLSYTQSAGTVVVGSQGAPTTDRGVFEVVNPGSVFNHSGGSLTIVRGINSTTVPSLWLEPGTSNITTGSTITIGNLSTPAGVNSQNIGIQSTVALNNLTIAGSNSPLAKIYISPLTVNGNLTVSTATTLNANSQNLTIGGNFTVDGTYVPTTNTTTFTNTGVASISGATTLFSFYNFTKTGAGASSIGKDITINQDLKLLAGSLGTSTFTVNLKRHAQIDATMTSTSGSGLIFNGSVQQQLSRTTGGTGSLGIVTVNNALGVIIPDGNGYNFDITSGLRLQQGIFDIGGALLFLGTNTTITPVNAFDLTNMIQTNSSFTDKGVKKQFPTGYTTDFTFPVGQLAYTPVTFNFSTAGNTTGTLGTPTITVRPANERHPSIVNDNDPGELPDPITFNDLNNALLYHWIINADNVASSFQSTMTMLYPQSAVAVVAPYTEADYIAARILTDANPTKLINKFTTSEVNETTNIITFNFTGVTDAGISAEYFAGVNVAIPDNVPIYTTIASGNVDAAVYTPAVPGGGAPTGASVIVSPGHNLTFGISNINLYETQISAGATVTIPSGSIGHRLGTVTGNGDLRIDSDISSATLPAAVYDDFFACSGGGLIFGGNGGYEIMAGITTVRNLSLFGPGTKIFGNNNVTICNNLTLNPTGILNTNNRILTVQNDLLVSGGIFNHTSSGGTLTITRDLVLSSGIFFGGASGVKTIGRDLIIGGGTFDPGSGSTNITQVNRNMTVADAAVFASGSAGVTGQRFRFGGSTAQTLTGTFTVGRAFNRLEINNTSSGLTLAGNTTIISELLLTAGHISPGTYTLLMEASAVSNPVRGQSTSFVNGKLYKVFSSAGDSFIFPIGAVGVAGNYWRSGAVRSVSAPGTWDMQFIGENADLNETVVTNMTPVSPVVRISTGGYWAVSDGTSTPSGKTATIGLSWALTSDVSASTPDLLSLRVVQWEPGTSQWVNMGATNFGPGYNQNLGNFDASSMTSFSRRILTLGSIIVANPLPVSFLSFTGKNQNGINVLSWSTASEKNNDYFELERSTNNAETFEVIGTLSGKGTSNVLSSYNFSDRGAHVGKNYYRLKQVDFDGKESYHPNLVVIELESMGDFLDFDAFPNPTEDQLINLNIFKNNSEPVQIRFYDVNGKICLSHEDTMFSLQLPTNRLSSGVYIIEVSQGFRRVTKRVVIKN